MIRPGVEHLVPSAGSVAGTPARQDRRSASRSGSKGTSTHSTGPVAGAGLVVNAVGHARCSASRRARRSCHRRSAGNRRAGDPRSTGRRPDGRLVPIGRLSGIRVALGDNMCAVALGAAKDSTLRPDHRDPCCRPFAWHGRPARPAHRRLVAEAGRRGGNDELQGRWKTRPPLPPEPLIVNPRRRSSRRGPTRPRLAPAPAVLFAMATVGAQGNAYSRRCRSRRRPKPGNVAKRIRALEAKAHATTTGRDEIPKSVRPSSGF